MLLVVKWKLELVCIINPFRVLSFSIHEPDGMTQRQPALAPQSPTFGPSTEWKKKKKKVLWRMNEWDKWLFVFLVHWRRRIGSPWQPVNTNAAAADCQRVFTMPTSLHSPPRWWTVTLKEDLSFPVHQHWESGIFFVFMAYGRKTHKDSGLRRKKPPQFLERRCNLRVSTYRILNLS